MGEERYVHSAEKDDVELERLRLQESLVDPVTIRHLETIGVREGWRCLDVGAGAGSIALWLSKRVGSTGRVLATDIDLRFLNRISASNLEIRRHDILRDEIEKGHYDLVFSRKLLHHLPETEKALKKMVDAISPGGWLLIEDDDLGSMLSADVTDPSLTPYVEIQRLGIDYYRKKGVADWYFGRRIRGLVERLGLDDFGHEGWCSIVHGGDPMARMWFMTYRLTVKTLVAEGVFTQEQYEYLLRLFMDPAFRVPSDTLFSAWGRKPVTQNE